MSGAGAPPSVAVWMTSLLVSSSRLLFDRCDLLVVVVVMVVVMDPMVVRCWSTSLCGFLNEFVPTSVCPLWW